MEITFHLKGINLQSVRARELPDCYSFSVTVRINSGVNPNRFLSTQSHLLPSNETYQLMVSHWILCIFWCLHINLKWLFPELFWVLGTCVHKMVYIYILLLRSLLIIRATAVKWRSSWTLTPWAVPAWTGRSQGQVGSFRGTPHLLPAFRTILFFTCSDPEKCVESDIV